jgi:4-hydroxybenzoate polyprenyltransferase
MTTNSQTNTDKVTVSVRQVQTRLHRFGKRLKRAVLFSSAYLAVIAIAEVLIVTELLSLPLTPAPVVAGLLTFAVYGNDRVADVESDETTVPARTAFVRRHHRLLYSLSALAYGLATALAVLGGPVAVALPLVPGGVWVCYAQDWLPLTNSINRLKQVFILNSVLVAGAWAIVVVFLPMAFAGAAATPTAGIVCLIFFLATFVDVEIPNIRDCAGDRELGIKTLPVVFGVRGTRYALYGVTSLATGLLVTAFADGLFTRAETVWLLVSLLYLTSVVAGIGRVDNNGRLTVAAECSRLPMLILVLSPLL